MENVNFCPYRTQIKNVQITECSKPVTFTPEVQFNIITLPQNVQYPAPITFSGTATDLELLEACKEKPDDPGM